MSGVILGNTSASAGGAPQAPIVDKGGKVSSINPIKKEKEYMVASPLQGKKVVLVEKGHAPAGVHPPVATAYPASPSPGPALTLPLHPDYYRLVESGKKTIEGRLHRPALALLKVGDILRLTNTANQGEQMDVWITSLKHYTSFREMLSGEGLEKCLPGINDLEAGVAIYYSFPNYQQEESIHGVLAMGIKRK